MLHGGFHHSICRKALFPAWYGFEIIGGAANDSLLPRAYTQHDINGGGNIVARKNTGRDGQEPTTKC